MFIFTLCHNSLNNKKKFRSQWVRNANIVKLIKPELKNLNIRREHCYTIEMSTINAPLFVWIALGQQQSLKPSTIWPSHNDVKWHTLPRLFKQQFMLESCLESLHIFTCIANGGSWSMRRVTLSICPSIPVSLSPQHL